MKGLLVVIVAMFTGLWVGYHTGHVEGQLSVPAACESRDDSVKVTRTVWPKRDDPVYPGLQPMTQAHVDSFITLTSGPQQRVP